MMEKLMTNPQLRQMEIDMVSEIVEQCNSMKDAALAAKAIDSFKLFIEKYPTS